MARKKLWDGGIILLLFTSGFFFFNPVLKLAETESLIGTDLHWLFLPATTFAFAAFHAGEFPLWNPNLFLGFPQFAEPQLSTFYPLFWLVANWQVSEAFSWLYAFHFGLTAAGGYVLARRWGARRAGGWVAGFTLGYCAFMFGRLYAGHLPHVMTIAYLPWVLAAADWAVGGKRPFLPTLSVTILAAIPLALAMLAGYAPFFPLLVGALTVYLGWRAAQRWQAEGWRGAAQIGLQWGGLGLIAGLLAAVQLLPTAQFALLSNRVAAANYDFANQFATPFWQLLTLAAPDLFGVPDWYPLPIGTPPHWAISDPPTYWESALYVGVLPLLLAGIGWFWGRGEWRFWGFLALGGLVLALGAEAAWHRLLYQVIPGFGLFRVPARFGYFVALGTAVLAGLSFDHWFNAPKEQFQVWRRWLQRGLLVATLLFLVLALLAVLAQAGETAATQQLRLQGISDQLLRLAFLLALSGGVLMWGYGQPRWRTVLAVVIILVLDLWGFGGKFLATQAISPNPGWTMANAALPGERHEYRVVSSGLPKNLAALYGFQHVGGYDDFRTETGYQLEVLAEKDARIAQLLGVRYHLHDPLIGGLPQTEEGWRYYTMLENIPVFEQVDALPRAFLVYKVIGAMGAAESLRLISQPEVNLREKAVVQVKPNTECAVAPGEGSVTISAYTPNEVRLQVTSSATGWLVLADLDYPGWVAQVNGRSAPIQPTNYGLRGVCIPAGSYEVVFAFRPFVLTVGAALSLTGLLLVIGAGVQQWITRRRVA